MTSFFVPGVPAPQGSKKLVPTKQGQRLISTNDASLKAWRKAVTFYTRAEGWHWPKPTPIAVELGFVMPATLKDRDGWCPVRPDIDKLARAVLDGLVDGGAMDDDSQVVKLTATKERGLHAGVLIKLGEL